MGLPGVVREIKLDRRDRDSIAGDGMQIGIRLFLAFGVGQLYPVVGNVPTIDTRIDTERAWWPLTVARDTDAGDGGDVAIWEVDIDETSSWPVISPKQFS